MDVICDKTVEERRAYIPEDVYIKSFSNKYGDYRCPDEEAKLDVIILIFYSGQLLGFFFCSLVGDLIRPKVLMVAGLAISLVGVVVLGFSEIMELSVAGMWLTDFGLTIPFNLVFIFVT